MLDKIKTYSYEKVLPILITAILSALISILGNILSAYTGSQTIHTNPETVGTLGLVLKSVHTSIKA